MREAYFHEDDYCQIELLPVDNLAYCLEEIGEIEKSAIENFEGMGFKDVYQRRDNPSEIAALNIDAHEFSQALQSHMPKFDVVATGYAAHKEECKSVSAFGHDNDEQIFVEHHNNIVTNIWLSDPFTELPNILPRPHEWLYVDWAWGFVCPLKETHVYIDYIAKRDAQMQKNAERTLEKYPELAPQKPWWKFW